jgi:hypothetical protein
VSNKEKASLSDLGKIAGYNPEHIGAFFDKVGGKRPCEACGNKDWVCLPKFAMIEAGFVDNSGFGVNLLPLFCSNCGNTRLFNRARIDEFVENEMPELSNDSE